MKTLPEGWTDRHTRVARFALYRMVQDAQARMTVIAQDKDNRLKTPPGVLEQYDVDLKDAIAARELLETILEKP